MQFHHTEKLFLSILLSLALYLFPVYFLAGCLIYSICAREAGR